MQVKAESKKKFSIIAIIVLIVVILIAMLLFIGRQRWVGNPMDSKNEGNQVLIEPDGQNIVPEEEVIKSLTAPVGDNEPKNEPSQEGSSTEDSALTGGEKQTTGESLSVPISMPNEATKKDVENAENAEDAADSSSTSVEELGIATGDLGEVVAEPKPSDSEVMSSISASQQ